ncbi:hypothetical protein RFI_03229 [Reticulomyxa filosa]|uniref:Uncharacterized protein n=1 Tax=Reticulomyxa filosa TaxID=46433 RepID=X6P747_RETFI|nr:hypothetical protein RFI_03229 [Reticulomyxa filosa]|eukprot:ETO33869.1 hypothetical protein RFI_03229 [Reticulomyxa filosa]
MIYPTFGADSYHYNTIPFIFSYLMSTFKKKQRKKKMGIQNLLKYLSSITYSVEIGAYSGKTVGVDGYCWLHKGVYSCCYELCNNVPTRRYIDHFIDLVQVLLHYNIKPIIVFDGCYLPLKQLTEDNRAQKRKENLKIARSLEREGKKDKAIQYYAKAVDVTPQMAYQCIQVYKKSKKRERMRSISFLFIFVFVLKQSKLLKQLKVEYIVAPYEADAQLAYLYRTNKISAVISEDSDLLVFGIGKVLFKWKRNDGKGEEIMLENLSLNDSPKFRFFYGHIVVVPTEVYVIR